MNSASRPTSALWPALRVVVAESTGVAPEHVTKDRTLDSFGIDSLLAAEIVVDLERTLGIEIDLELLRDMSFSAPIGDFVGALEQQLGPAGS